MRTYTALSAGAFQMRRHVSKPKQVPFAETVAMTIDMPRSQVAAAYAKRCVAGGDARCLPVLVPRALLPNSLRPCLLSRVTPAP